MRYDRNQLNCFSPPVMIATFVIEIALVVYTLWRYRLTPVTRLSALLFVSLGTFQLAEYMVCQGVGGDSLVWSRIGFIAITLLPPLGIHLLAVITKSRWYWVICLSYLLAAAFVAFFMLVGHSITGHSCLGNYVIFQVAPGSGRLFGAYYYGLLAVALGLGWYQVRQAHSRNTKRAINGLMVGYLVFIVPTILVNLINPATVSGIPSIMCGFAVLLALIVGFIILPAQAEKK